MATATRNSNNATTSAKRTGKMPSAAVAAVPPNGESTSRSYVPATSSWRTPAGRVNEERTMPKMMVPTTTNAKYSAGDRKGATCTSLEM